MSKSDNEATEPESIPAPEDAEVVAHGDDEELEACCVLLVPN